MISKLLALALCTALLFAIGVGNMYYTYGLWPKSFAAYVLFMALSYVGGLMTSAVIRDLGRD